VVAAVVAAVVVVEEVEGEILPAAEVTALWRLPLILVVEVEVALMFLSIRTEEVVQAGGAIDPQGKSLLAEEGATVIVLGDSVSACVSAPVRRVVRRRDLGSVDLSGDAIERLKRRQRKRLLWSVVPSLSQTTRLPFLNSRRLLTRLLFP